MVVNWFTSLIKFVQQFVAVGLRRYQRFAIAFLLTTLLAINLSPSSAIALDFGDLFRILPSAIQVIQLSNVSDNDEVNLGRQINAQISQQVRISRDRNAIRLVRRLGEMLVPNSDRPNIPYTFQVVEDNSINAFATMGGFVYINTGTIASADNAAQLASVIAHEMGHIGGRHALEQMKQAAITQGIATAIGVENDQLVGLGAQLALQLPLSREDEFDADRRGLLTISRSGFAPQAMPAFMQKLVNSGGGTPAFLNSHPATPDRINALNELIRQNNLASAGGGLNDREYQSIWRSRYR
ncbi:M48 family metallopeptidase [Tumidithrix elongata]|uniref:M48 family metallopeptidase n=1 Tax=Tumidithrix elongata TaxID=3088357 RepID=UPI002ECFFB5E